MFDIGWGELMLIGVVALIAIGPKELPSALRTLGQWMTKIRRMAGEFQNQFHEAMREAELSELHKEVGEMAAKAREYTHFDPIAEMGTDLEKTANLPNLDGPIVPASSAAAEPSLPAPETAHAPALPPPESAADPVPAVDAVPAAGEVAAKPDAGKAA